MSRCVTFPVIVASGELGGTTRFRGRTSLFFFFTLPLFRKVNTQFWDAIKYGEDGEIRAGLYID